MHLDVMDGHFVPNISFGPQVVKAIRPLTKLFFDVHLMCSRPEILLESFAKAGADEMILHVELGGQIPSLLRQIRALGKKVGLAVNPPTDINAVRPFLDQLDLLLVMTVNPGFGGQEFLPLALDKIAHLAELREEMGLNFRIEVDGGIAHDTVALVVEAGADMLVAGSAIFSPGKTEQNAQEFLKLARAASPAQI